MAHRAPSTFRDLSLPRPGGLILCALLAIATTAAPQVAGMKTFENRIEGTIVQPNALEDLVILAIHRSFETFKPGANLSVRFFLPTMSSGSIDSVSVEASEVRDFFHYSMRSKGFQWNQLTWNVFQPWPTQDIIDKLNLHPDNIAVRASYKRGDGQHVYLPVDVYDSTHSFGSGNSYRFHFFTAHDLRELDIHVSIKTGTGTGIQSRTFACDTKNNPDCVIFSAGTNHFDLDFSTLPEGEYNVRLVGHFAMSSEQAALPIGLYHHPSN